jgi:hypothetical protein
MSSFVDAVRSTRRYAVAITILTLLSGGVAAAEESIARQWNELLLDAIRNDFARPTVHARNLFHVSVAMWDGWAAYDLDASNYLHMEKLEVRQARKERARKCTISFASYRIIKERFQDSPGAEETLEAIDAKMADLGFPTWYTNTMGPHPAALGNRIAQTVLEHYIDDGSNEAGGYENEYYKPVNHPLLPDLPGNPYILDPDRWQPLLLDFFIDQSGNIIPGGMPDFLSPEWGQVVPFALSPADLDIYERDDFDYWVYHNPGPPPLIGTEYYKWGFEMDLVWSSHLDPADGVMIDISPGALGNAPLPDPSDWENYYDFFDGGDWGTGHPLNPVTGLPYPPNLVPRGDYGRVLAEFWADGPDSETPPGHWFTIANYVADHPLFVKRWRGTGPILDDLEWDVRLSFTLGGAMHDAAIASWGIKGWFDFIRPVSAIRHMAFNLGQSSEPGSPNYDPQGIRLYPGLIELITPASTAPGERHEHLAGYEDEIAVYAWRGPDYIIDPDVDVAGVGWIRVANWWPYQRPTFVTPPFAGYISGHSTYSRAASELMTQVTGSQFFPGGVGEFFCPQNEFLVFEDGPSVDVTLQWATYHDASDQTSLSRIWGGIHPPADDLPGRIIGTDIANDAVALAETYFPGPGDGQISLGDGESPKTGLR